MCPTRQTPDRQRLDHALAARGLAPSRSRAGDLVRRGLVSVDGMVVAKPGALVASQCRIEVAGEAAGWVSRGAEKLIAALDAFGFDAAGRVALDIGASTGGFSEALLRRGARRIYAVDVGSGQLHPRLAADPRVVALERTDARALDVSLVPEPVGMIVADVSFIGLAKALPAALALAAPGALLVALVKPQFEVGPGHVGKGGIVRDAGARAAAVRAVVEWIAGQSGWRIVGSIASPITGADGNEELLVGAARDG